MMGLRCFVIIVAVGCSDPITAPEKTPWMPVFGDAHISEFNVRFLADRAVFAIEGRFEAPIGDRRVVSVDYDDQPLSPPWVFDDLSVDAARFVPLIEQGAISVVARRSGELVEYRASNPPTRVSTGNSRRFAIAPVVGGHVILAQNTLNEVTALYQPDGQLRSESALGMATADSVVAAASIGDGVLMIGEDAELRAYAVTAAPFAVSAPTTLATLPCPMTGILVSPQGNNGALVIALCDDVAIVGTLTAGPLSWQQRAVIDGRSRAESLDIAALVTNDVADIVIQTDALTVVPALIHYRVDLATGNVESGAVLTDGVQRFGRQVLAQEPNGGISIYALRTDPGSVRLVRASLQELLERAVAIAER